jgi:hypothetical protein
LAPDISAWKRIESDYFANVKIKQKEFTKHITTAISTGNLPDSLSEICIFCWGASGILNGLMSLPGSYQEYVPSLRKFILTLQESWAKYFIWKDIKSEKHKL